MFKWINNKIRRYIIKRANEQRSVDIIEVKVKEIGLLSVKSETKIRFENSFFLPIKIISINTELYNGTVVVGEMNYETPQIIPKKSFIEITTISEISIITSFFQMLSNLLAQPISLRSVGIARLKILWWEVEIPVDDTFKILPHQLKVKKEETEEEKAQRLIQEEARKIKRIEEKAIQKEAILKRRHKKNYVPKELRGKQEGEPEKMGEKLADNEIEKEVEKEIDKMEDNILKENE